MVNRGREFSECQTSSLCHTTPERTLWVDNPDSFPTYVTSRTVLPCALFPRPSRAPRSSHQ